MAFKLKGDPKVMPVTHALAVRFRDMNPCPQDRPLSARRVESHKQAMRDGTFREAEFATVTCKQTGETYRANGKHQSHAFADLNGELADGKYLAVVKEYECDVLEDVACLYSTFDSSVCGRTQQDINHVYGGASAELRDVPGWVLDRAVSGISYSTWVHSVGKVAKEKKAVLLLGNTDFVTWLAGWAMKSENRQYQRTGTVAAMHRTFRLNQQASRRFWDLVCTGKGQDHEGPDRVLHDRLLQIASQRSVTARAKLTSQLADSRALMYMGLTAWNLWRKGGRGTLKYSPAYAIPEII